MANALSYSLNEPSPLKPMPNATAPAPAPMAKPTANALAAPSSGPSPYAMPKKQPQNALLGAAVDGFMRGFAPQQWQQNQDQRKADGAEKAKQTLALMQQQRAIPEQQRGQWWQQNAPTISEIVGQDVSQMPLDVSKFSDQALDGQIAALSAQLGIAPSAPEPFTLAPGAQRFGANGQVVASNPVAEKPEAPVKWEQFTDADGQIWDVNPYTRERIKADGMRGRVPGDGSDGFTLSKDQIRYDANGKPIAYGRSDPASDPNASMDPERIRLEREFSRDWKTIETDWGKIDGDYKRIQAMGRQAASDPERASAADLALIVGFTKMQDPGSVAREGEVALTQQTVGVLDQANNLLNQWQNGKTVLPTDARVNILRAAEELHRVYSDAYRKRGEEYAAAAQQYQYPLSRVMMGYDPGAPQQAPTMQSAASDLVKATPPSFAWMTKGFQGGQPQSAPRPQAQPQTRQPTAQFNVPLQAVQELMADPSPEAMAEFDDAFGPGAAEAALNGSR